MGIPGQLHGKEMPNGGKHFMKLRSLLTQVEDKTSEIKDENARESFILKTREIRVLLATKAKSIKPKHRRHLKLNLIQSIKLGRLNRNFENNWNELYKNETPVSIQEMEKTIEKLLRFLQSL
jgi:hypothetical protein